jgi:23S rRNA pseudouridine2605 synthase
LAPERLQKLIARSGACSRREAEEWIREGRVTVNGRVAVLGDQADPAVDAVKVDGKRLKTPQTLRYLLLYKPTGVVTTVDDPEGRPSVMDLMRGAVRERVFPVGRLDFHSEGLLVLTNDGELALRLSHPRYGVGREYTVKVRGVPDAAAVEKLRRGTVIEGTRVIPREVELLRLTPSQQNSWWRVVVGEGKTHEVRELFGRAGHPVQRLIRTAIGELRDETLKPGMWRQLQADEVELLRGSRTRRGERGKAHVQTAGPGVHQAPGRVRSGQTHRGSAARAGGGGDRQAGLQRKPPGNLAQGAGGDSPGAGGAAPLPRRWRLRPASGDRRPPRG